MSTKKQTLRNCRICGGSTNEKNPEYPFCSDACRERDLGNWASGSYRIAAEFADEEDASEMNPRLSESAFNDE